MAPGVGLGQRRYDTGQCSSFCCHCMNQRSFWPAQRMGEDTAQPLIFSLPLHNNEKINDKREVSVYQDVLYHNKSKVPENLLPCQRNYSQRQKVLLIIKHAVNFWFSFPLASKTVSTLGIVLNSLYCKVTQSFDYWFRCCGEKKIDTNFSLWLVSVSLVFLRSHTGSVKGQAAQAAGVMQLFLPALPLLFLLLHASCSPLPL